MLCLDLHSVVLFVKEKMRGHGNGILMGNELMDDEGRFKIEGPEKRFDEFVEQLKAMGFNTGELLLIGEVELRLICAWPSVPRKIEEPIDGSDNPWRWLKFNPREWERHANVRIADWERMMGRMMRGRLIFPDGEIQPQVVSLIESRVKKIHGERLSCEPLVVSISAPTGLSVTASLAAIL